MTGQPLDEQLEALARVARRAELWEAAAWVDEQRASTSTSTAAAAQPDVSAAVAELVALIGTAATQDQRLGITDATWLALARTSTRLTDLTNPNRS